MACAAWALALGACIATAALSATFYKWTDKDGNVYYSDKVPKGFAGPVTRVEVEPAAHVAPLAPAAKAEAQPPASEAAPQPPPDILTERRATRARLEGDLAKARGRLDLARKALADFTTGGEQGQYIQRQVDPSALNRSQGAPGPSGAQAFASTDATQSAPARGGMLGMTPRSTCHEVTNKDGRKVLVCPTIVGNEQYYQEAQRLDDEVKRAEEAVADAERAYRRGVD